MRGNSLAKSIQDLLDVQTFIDLQDICITYILWIFDILWDFLNISKSFYSLKNFEIFQISHLLYKFQILVTILIFFKDFSLTSK